MGIPVILINGFLESGKTFFINSGILEDAFGGGNILVLACERGSERFNRALFTEKNVHLHFLREEADFDRANLSYIINKYRPEIIVMEINGMWDYKNLVWPEFLYIDKQITLIDAIAFNMYFNNMRERFVDMVKDSHFIIVNRCLNQEEAGAIKRSLRLINKRAAYVLLDREYAGIRPDDELPFKLDGDIIRIADGDYGIWYADTFDSRDRYKGRTVEFNAMAVLSNKLPKNSFIAARWAITCCEDDKQLVGHICETSTLLPISDRAWYRIVAEINYRFSEEYKEEETVLKVKEMTQIKEIRNPVITLN